MTSHLLFSFITIPLDFHLYVYQYLSWINYTPSFDVLNFSPEPNEIQNESDGERHAEQNQHQLDAPVDHNINCVDGCAAVGRDGTVTNITTQIA